MDTGGRKGPNIRLTIGFFIAALARPLGYSCSGSSVHSSCSAPIMKLTTGCSPPHAGGMWRQSNSCTFSSHGRTKKKPVQAMPTWASSVCKTRSVRIASRSGSGSRTQATSASQNSTFFSWRNSACTSTSLVATTALKAGEL